MNLEKQLTDLAASLPPKERGRLIREVCLTRHEDGTWTAMAGGHPSVHIGEYGGDFDGAGATPEEAISACRAKF